ncbi:programmed cell death protein 2 [Dioscorea cayenensis subsp. rotundata]|uniref:Programmed cell death protein 2 n=1 Tax=Dioscorea cayennensis subsp. rotundata TaxID=55577 RepID=A0AB40CEP5_DIOCR|nr:programmed cell death protein 2 [Dioscorea cayenensis subsp. rotundata]XP_039136828.1 programmed cell death protein 2 [Dioscorea cayenensis subsp. rotundata]XP_039136829.1 programmed cell death protein 2 [Dioscorea cayenensis subsp. rotundata]
MASSAMDHQLEVINSLRITPLDDDDEGQDEVEEIEIDEDDEEEEEDEEGVTLGFVEKPKNPRSLLRHLFPSKAGGVPAWLDPVDLPPESARTCGFCGDPLQFLLQIYAPISEKESTFHRTFFVFMCPSMACLLRDQHEQWKHGVDKPHRSVKVFRCQLPRSNPFYSSEPPKYDGTDKPLSTGAVLCSWCGTWKGEKVCGSCRKARYCSEKHQLMHWRSGHKNDCRQIFISSHSSVLDHGNGREKLPAIEKVACRTLWREHEIAIEDESTYESNMSDDNGCGTSIVPANNKKDETFQSVLNKFEANADKKKWASFQERIARAPEQVLRYCRDLTAKPLWPLLIGRPSKEDIPKCNYCKGPLCYEFQIMPQLLYYFDVKNEPDSLDWATIVVFTCLNSCEASLAYKEEFAWVQLYPSTGTL